MTYDYACSLTRGNFIPPGFHPVSSCNFYGFVHVGTGGTPPTSPTGTGGGASPKAVAGVRFDLTRPEDWNKTKPLVAQPEPEEPDVRYVTPHPATSHGIMACHAASRCVTFPFMFDGVHNSKGGVKQGRRDEGVIMAWNGRDNGVTKA
jgi:hypothetical protein